MAKLPTHADKKGMTAALDLVEDALASLQEKVSQQRRPELKDAETNTAPFHSDVPKSRRKKQKETSVLISRRPREHSDRSRSHRQHYREETLKNRNQKSIPKARQPKHPKKSRHHSDHSLSSRSDISHKSCRSTGSNTSQSSSRNSVDIGQCRGHESIADSLHPESSVGIIDTQRGDKVSKNVGISSSKKRGNRNRGNSSESSSDELLQRRKHKSQVEPPQNSQQSHQRSQEGGTSDLRISYKDRQKEGNVQSGQLQSNSHQSQKHNQRVSPRKKKTIPVSCQSYAQPTLTSKFRDELLDRKEKEEKENITPFIPCGSKSKSYHIGVIVQQELGRIKNMTPKDLEHFMVPSTSREELGADETGSDSEGVTEQTVRRALSNIHQHIALATKHTSKK